MASSTRGLVTIVLPTFNREAFMVQAFASIRQQEYQQWELIVVDDGSTDGTESTVARLTKTVTQSVTYIRQPNGGAYAARNAGCRRATGDYIAFFDSDDSWFPHHLGRCVDALDAHPELDWVFGAVTRVDHATGAVLDENSFYPAGKPRPFLRLRSQADGDLRVIDDPAVVECQLVHGLYCGLQNSVTRRRVFATRVFREDLRVVEDEMFLVRSLVDGARIGYYLAPHVLYRVHEGNSSGSAKGQSAAQALAIARELVSGLEQLEKELPLTARQRRALRLRLSHVYFWHLGYHNHWRHGRVEDAFAAYRHAISLRPWKVSYWKAYTAARLRALISRSSGAAS